MYLENTQPSIKILVDPSIPHSPRISGNIQADFGVPGMKQQRPQGRSTNYFARVFGLDLRSLALFRIAVSLFILYDLASRAFDLTAHYTDSGAVSRAWAFQYFAAGPIYRLWNPAYLSVHFLTGSTLGTALLFLINGIAAIGLLVGYRTRLMTIMVWYFLASLQARNPLVLSVGDNAVLVLLFFSMFLPLGCRYAIDTKRRTSEDVSLYVSPASAIYYLQFISIYFFGALLKSGPEWRSEGTALYYAFNIDQFAMPAAKALLNYPEFLKVLTFAAWWTELLGGFLLLIPNAIGKLSGIIVIAGLQVWIGTTLALGHNPWVNTLTLLPFLPSIVWDRTNKWPALSHEQPWRKHKWSEALAIFLFAAVLIYNVAWLAPIHWLSDYLEFPVVVARLEQYWGMFAPAPNKDDGWYVVEGRLSNGSKIDAFRGTHDIKYEKPASATDFYPNERWRRYMMNIGTRDFKDFRLPFVQYLCSQWNPSHPGAEHLEQVSIFFNREVTPPPGQSGAVQKLLFFDYICSQ
jgi:hypothetical protein